MEKEKALEYINELERIKESINRFDEETLKYQNAALRLNESSKKFVELSGSIKSIIRTFEDISNELSKISSEEVMEKFKDVVDGCIKEIIELKIQMQAFDKNISLITKNQKNNDKKTIVFLICFIILVILAIFNLIL